MPGLAAIVVWLVELPSPVSIGASPLPRAELAAVTARAIEPPATLAAAAGTGIALDSDGRRSASPISILIVNTAPRSVAQAETSLKMALTLRMR
ncbi:MAG: hypothetical protein ACHP9T_10835 [Caulobacterales bacterium]|jgi:hypothetical protein